MPDAGRIVLDLGEGAASSGWLQPLAGGTLWTAAALGPGAVEAARPAIAAYDDEHAWVAVYDGPGLVDGGLHRIRCWRAPDGARRVAFEDGETFWIAPGGEAVRRLPAEPELEGGAAARTLERAVGAPLALALASRGVVMLHASALRGGSGVLALTAASGAGKSTLAAAAAAFPALCLARIADDLLPVRLSAGPMALPHFPQLKLVWDDWYPAGAPAALPLAAVVEIEHHPKQADLAVERLTPAAACVALSGATVAARLFDATLLADHFDACATAARSLPVFRLRYPSGFDRLGEALAALAEIDRGLAG